MEMQAAGSGSRFTICAITCTITDSHGIPAPADVPPDPTLACIKEALEEINVSVLTTESDGSDQLVTIKGFCRDATFGSVCATPQPRCPQPQPEPPCMRHLCSALSRMSSSRWAAARLWMLPRSPGSCELGRVGRALVGSRRARQYGFGRRPCRRQHTSSSGTSPHLASKLLLCNCRYEVPDIKFEGLAMRFMDIRKRVYEVGGCCQCRLPVN